MQAAEVAGGNETTQPPAPPEQAHHLQQQQPTATTTDSAADVVLLAGSPPPSPPAAAQSEEGGTAVPAFAASSTGSDVAEEKSESNGKNDDVAADASAIGDGNGSRVSWDHSNRRVFVTNVFKFDDIKKMRKTVSKWLADMNRLQREQQQVTSGDVAGDRGGGCKKFEYQKVKKPPNETWMVVTMKDEWMVEPLIDYINEHDGGRKNKRGLKLFAKRPDDDDDGGKKRKADGGPGDERDDATKRQKMTPEAIRAARRPVSDDEIRDATTPLWRMSEKDQLSSKKSELIKKCAIKIVKEIKSRFAALRKDKSRKIDVTTYDWLTKKRSIDIDDVVPVPSPIRNKCEFTFGYRYLFGPGKEGDGTVTEKDNGQMATREDHPKVPAVGFMVTGWAGGVSRPHACANISSEACAIVDMVERFLADSPLPPYDSKLHVGVWRTLTVRSSRRTKECMVIIQHAPVTGGVGDKEESTSYADSFDSEKDRLLSLLKGADLPVPDCELGLKVTSVFFQEFGGLSTPSPEHPVQHAYGKTSLLEQVGKCTFQISPGAFFQVNTRGAELLFERVVDKVREVSKDPDDTLLFDVCCGTGTIGVSCMKEGVVGHVVGVDISEPAIEDAKRNAELNGYHATDGEENKVRFVAARAETILGREIGKKMKETKLNFVAVVDPARDGLHADVIKALRTCSRIRRIVYVSCNPIGSLVRDAGLLCSPPTKKYGGQPFQVESACPVDMFPLSNHCELVMTFDRLEGNPKE